MNETVFEKRVTSDAVLPKARRSGSSWRAVLLVGALAICTSVILISVPLSSVGGESLHVLWVGGALFVALCFALGSAGTRVSGAQKALFVLWGFLLISEGFFARVGTIDSAYAGSFNIAAYGEALIWVLSFLMLIPLFLGSPLPIQRLFTGHYRWVVLYGAMCVISCAYSPRPSFSAAWALKLIVVILLIHLCSAYISTLRDVDAFLRFTFWALALLVINWVFQGDGTHHFFDEEGRLYGADGLSATAGTLLLLSFTLYSSTRDQGLKRAAIAVGAITFVIMVVAGGKAGIVSGLISGILFFVLRKGFGTAAGFLAGALVVGMLVVSLSPLSRYLQNYAHDDQAATLTGRTPLWEVAIPAIEKKPILGHGYVSSTFVAVLVNGVPWEAGHMHNGFLEALYNTGLIGFVLIVAMHVIIARNLLRVIRRASPAEYLYQLGVGCFAIYVNLLINGFANASFGGRAWHPFMVLIALVVISDKLAVIAASEDRNPVPVLVTNSLG